MFLNDRNNHRIQIMDSLGNYQGQFGSSAVLSPGGVFFAVSDVLVDIMDSIFVLQGVAAIPLYSSLGNILIFGSNGNFTQLGSTGTAPDQFQAPLNFDFDSHGYLYLVEHGLHMVKRWRCIP